MRSSIKPIFLVVDEFAALRISMDKKEFNAINDSLKRIILMGRSANSFINGTKKAETFVLMELN